MITLSDITSRFEHFATNHGQLSSFSFGQLDDLNAKKLEQFPIMHLFYGGASYDSNVKDYKFEVYLLSRTGNQDDAQQEYDSISDMENIAEDLISDIERGFTSFSTTGTQDSVVSTGTLRSGGTEGGFLLQDANVMPMINTETGRLTGTQLSLSIRVASPYDSCFKP